MNTVVRHNARSVAAKSPCGKEVDTLPKPTGCPAGDEYFFVANAENGWGAGGYALRSWQDIMACSVLTTIEVRDPLFLYADIEPGLDSGTAVFTDPDGLLEGWDYLVEVRHIGLLDPGKEIDLEAPPGYFINLPDYEIYPNELHIIYFKPRVSTTGGTPPPTGVSKLFGIEDNTGIQNRLMNLGGFSIDIIGGTPDYSGQTSRRGQSAVQITDYVQYDPDNKSMLVTAWNGVGIGSYSATKSKALSISPAHATINYNGIITNDIVTSIKLNDITYFAGEDGSVDLGTITVPETILDWHALGNAGTDDTVNFLGTTDGKKLIIKTNNEKRFGVTSTYAGLETYSTGSSVPGGGFFVNGGNATMTYPGANIGISGGHVGNRSLSAMAGGYWNVAIGDLTLNVAVGAAENVAVGYQAMRDIVNGSNNVAVGSYAMRTSTTAQYNVAIGFESMGNDPVPIAPMTGGFNTCVGMQTMKMNRTGYGNVAIGAGCMQYSLHTFNNICIGTWCMIDGSTGNYNVCVGPAAGMMITDGARNVVIGGSASYQSQNTAVIGNDSDNVYIGENAGGERGGGNKNVAIGGKAASNVISGNGARGIRNINIGYGSGATGNAVVASIVIGARVSLPSTTLAGQLNIGNVLYGINLYNHDTTVSSAPTATGSIGIGVTTPTARLHLPAGTATINTAPLKFTTGTPLDTPENGAIEYDNDHLWFTTSGVRYQLDRQTGGGGATASNGLSKPAADIILGGPLTAVTTINNAGFGFNIINSTNSTRAIYGENTANGTGIYGKSASGTALYGTSTSGIALQSYSVSNTAILAGTSPAVANSIPDSIVISNSPSVAVSDGVGAALVFSIKESSAGNSPANKLISKWTNSTLASLTSEFSITGYNNNTSATLFTLSGNGKLALNKYTGTTFDDPTPFKSLGVNATGELVTFTAAGGGSATASNGLSKPAADIILGGPLTGNTIIAGGTLYRLEITANYTGVVNDGVFKVTNSSSATAIFGSVVGNGIGVRAVSTTGSAVQAVSTSGIGMNASSTSGRGATITSASSIGLQVQSDGGTYAIDARGYSAASNNVVVPVVKVLANTGVGPSAAGFGAKIDYHLMTTDFATSGISNSLISKWTDAVHATKTSQFIITGVNLDVTADIVTLDGNGRLTLNKYTGATMDAAPFKSLGIDATGKLVTSALTKFGKTGEDVIAAEDRNFNANQRDISISNALTIGMYSQLPSVSFNGFASNQDQAQVIWESTSGEHVNYLSVGSFMHFYSIPLGGDVEDGLQQTLVDHNNRTGAYYMPISVKVDGVDYIADGSGTIDIGAVATQLALIKRLTTKERTRHKAFDGEMVYDKTTHSHWFWNGTIWKMFN